MTYRVCLVIDLDRCWGCKACEVACKQELELGPGPRPMSVIQIGPRQIDGKLHRDYVPTMCQHCEDPACLEACPTGAIYRGPDGSIQIDTNTCNGCISCQELCPFGVVEVIEQGKPAIKCNLCFSRRIENRLPSCAQHCPGRAFTLITERELPQAIADRYSWSTGRVVYVSSKWSSLGKALTYGQTLVTPHPTPLQLG